MEQLFLELLSEQNKVSIDIGANVGAYTEILKKRTFVYAFEPIPETFTILLRKFEKCDNVRVRQLALSDHIGISKMYIPILNQKYKYGWASFYNKFQDKYPFREISVNTSTIDEEKISDVTLMKIDAEGSELDIIKGAVETIGKYRPNIIIEIEERHKEGTLKKTTSFLRELGYKGMYIDLHNRKIKAFEESFIKQKQHEFLKGIYPMYYYNFIFVPSENYKSIFEKLKKQENMIKLWIRMRSNYIER